MRRGEESQVVRIRGDELKTAPIAQTPIIILRLYMGGVCEKLFTLNRVDQLY